MKKNNKSQRKNQRQSQKNKRNTKHVKFNLKKNKTKFINRNRRTKKNNSRRRRNNKRQNIKKSLKGGAIPFSELGLSFDNIKYGINGVTSTFGDNAPYAPSNPESSNVNPNPTVQFVRTTSEDSSQLGPALGEIFNSNY